MRLFQRGGEAPGQLQDVGTRHRPRQGPAIGQRRDARPLQRDVRGVVVEPRIEHSDGRRMLEARRQPEPRGQAGPSPGVRPGAGQVAELDRARVVPLPPGLDFRSIRDAIGARTELGQQPVSVQTHRPPRSGLDAVPPSPAASRIPTILQDGRVTRKRAGIAAGCESDCSWKTRARRLILRHGGQTMKWISSILVVLFGEAGQRVFGQDLAPRL